MGKSYARAKPNITKAEAEVNNGKPMNNDDVRDNEDYEKYVPRGITDEDMKAILAFGQLINIKSIFISASF